MTFAVGHVPRCAGTTPALEPGASPEIVSGWINETQAKRAAAEARLRQRPTGRRRMTQEEIAKLARAPGDLMTAVGTPRQAGRRAVIAVGPICRYRAHGNTFESCSSGKLSCRQYTSTQRTNGASPGRGTQMSLSGSVAPGTSTAICPSRPGYHTPGTSSPSCFDSADGRSGSGSPTTRNATSWPTALRLTCSSRGEAPPAQPRTAVAIKLSPP